MLHERSHITASFVEHLEVHANFTLTHALGLIMTNQIKQLESGQLTF